MHKTQVQACGYAQQLADLHREPRVVVKLPLAEPGSGRHRHGVTGRFYGGVRLDEVAEFVAAGAEVLNTVHPRMTAEQKEAARQVLLGVDRANGGCWDGVVRNPREAK